MNKKRLAKAFALSAALSLSTVAAISLAGCNNEEKHTHELTEVTAVEATCTTDGHIAYWTCSGCDLIFADASGAEETTLADTVRSKLGHELGDEHHHAADPATCTEPGTREYWECGRCELKFSDAEGKNQITDVVTTKDHSLSEGYHEMVFPTTDATGTRSPYVQGTKAARNSIIITSGSQFWGVQFVQFPGEHSAFVIPAKDNHAIC